MLKNKAEILMIVEAKHEIKARRNYDNKSAKDINSWPVSEASEFKLKLGDTKQQVCF